MPPPAPRPAVTTRRNPWDSSTAQTPPAQSVAPPAEDQETEPSDASPDGDDDATTNNLAVESPSNNEDGPSDLVEADATSIINAQQPMQGADDGEGGNIPSTTQPPLERATDVVDKATPDSSDEGLPPNNYVRRLDPDGEQDLQR